MNRWKEMQLYYIKKYEEKAFPLHFIRYEDLISPTEREKVLEDTLKYAIGC